MQLYRKLDINRYNYWKEDKTTAEISFITEKFNKIFIYNIDISPGFIGETLYVDIVDTDRLILQKHCLHINVLHIRSSEYILQLTYELIIDYIRKRHRKILLELRRNKLLIDTKHLIDGGKNGKN